MHHTAYYHELAFCLALFCAQVVKEVQVEVGQEARERGSVKLEVEKLELN